MSTMHSMSSTVAGMGGSSTLHSSAAPVSTALGLGSNGATATSNLSVPRTTLLSSSSGVYTHTHTHTHLECCTTSRHEAPVWSLLLPSSCRQVKLLPTCPRACLPSCPTSTSWVQGGCCQHTRSTATRTSICSSPGSRCPPCRITTESHFLAPRRLFPTETGAWPTTPTQAFLPPGYSYTGLPYYAGVPGAVPSAAAFQYGPTMFVPPGGPGPASAKQHSMGLGLANPSASPFQQQTQQQPSGYGQHTFSSGYEELTAGPAGVDYSKGYNSSSQTQAKSAASGPGKGR
ncbi:unnamed protein product, partial [Tetraodon nigroviridis]